MRGSQALRLLRQLTAGGLKLQAAPSCTTTPWAGSTTGSVNGFAVTSTQWAAAFDKRGLSSSPAAAAAAAAASSQVTVQGDLSGVLAEVDAVVSAEDVGPKDVADAAMALAYLQARGDRRLWGKIFERAAAAKGDFDAASLTAFLWAATTAGVGHFKTVYELAGPAAKLLPRLNADQLATVVEALGAAGVNDLDFFKAVSGQVVSKAADLSASQLSKILWGFAAAGVHDAALTKAVLGALAGKAGSAATAKDLAQLVWALAKLRRSDGATLGQLSKALTGKLGGGEAPSDLLAAVWGFAELNHKPDAALLTKATAAVKGAVADLTSEQQVYATWSLALLGVADKEVFSALFSALGAKLAAAPDSLPVQQVALLAEAQLLVADKLGAQAPKLPEQVSRYALAMHGIAAEAAKERAGAAGKDFRSDVANATARAMGARYKPEIAAAVKGLPKRTEDGLNIDFALDSIKVAVLPVDASGLSSNKPHVPLGSVVAAGQVLRSQGYAPAVVPAPEFNAQPDDKAKAKFVLAAIKAAAPGASSQINSLEKKLNEPFDPYAE